MDSRSDPEKKIHPSSLYLALLPVILCLALMVLLHLASPTHPITRMVFEPPFLLPILNTIFIFLVGYIISYLAMRGYLSQGSPTILFLGCGLLSIGSGAFVAGWLIGPWGPNVNTTVFTLSALLSSIFLMAGMIVNVTERPPEADLAGRRRKLAVAYPGLLALVAVVALATVAGIIPPFFVRGAGPTILRQVFVAITLALFIITSSSMMVLFVQKGVRFFYWYSLGLALFAINSFGALLQPALGSPMGWVARGSAYLAGIYFLVAVLSASREARTQGIALSDRFADIFRKSERKISFIFASMTDCYYELDREWRFTRINDQCLAYFGRNREEFIGQLFGDVLPEDKGSIFEEQYKLAFSEGIAVQFEVQSLIAPGRWADIHAYPTEEGLSVFVRDITLRKQAERALRESEQRWATTLASIGDAVIATDVEGKIAFMNAMAEEMTGWAISEAAMKPAAMVFNIINEQTRKQVESPITKVLREGMVVGLANHTTLVRKDGTEVSIDDSGAPIRDADGKTMGVVLVFRDITERKRAEEHTEHLASFPQLNPNPIIEVNASGKVIFYNPATQRTLKNLGIEGGKVEAFSPDDLSAILRDWDQTSESAIYREVMVADRVFGEAVQLVPQFKVARIYAGDITDRKRAEEALRESEERYRNLFNTMDEGFCVIEMIFDTEGRPSDYRFLKINAAFEKQTGLHDAEGKLMRDLAPDHEAHWFEIYGKIALTGEPLRFVNEARALNRWYDVYAYRVNKPEDRQVAIVFHDISAQKRAEEALRKAHDELELRVQKRTEELRNAYERLQEETREREQLESQLRQAQKMEAVGTLAGGIAHDFNNMLAAIIGNAELAMDDVPEEMTARHNLDQIFKAGMRARGLIRQILTFSRKTEHERKRVPLTPLVNETFKLLRASLPTSIEMRLNIETPSDVALADPVQIQQVLMNLCTNAADAVRHTGGRFEITLADTVFSEDGPLPEADMQPGAYVTLAVSDTGAGMDEDVKSRIFEPFFTTKERGQGTGMGLAVVYGIVKSHQGAITVLSQPGEGATFTVYLPRHTSGEKADETMSRPVPKGKERILFVDDEEMLVEMAEGMLDRLGYRVLGKTDSVDAFQTFVKDPGAFDLVITDQTMPRMTGADLAQKLREIRPDIPLILCTGYSETISQEKAESMGIDGFVMKPLSRNELAETVRRVLDTKARA